MYVVMSPSYLFNRCYWMNHGENEVAPRRSELSVLQNHTRGTELVQSDGSTQRKTLGPLLAPSLMGWEMLNQYNYRLVSK